jgi:hypothetical protein
MKSALHQRVFEENETGRVVNHTGEGHLYTMHLSVCHGPLTNEGQVGRLKPVLGERLLVPWIPYRRCRKIP